MTLLATVLEKLQAASTGVEEEALALAERLLAPAGPLPRSAVKGLLARARRNGAWPRLPRETRALLVAAAAARARIYRSPILLAALRRAWLYVELATARGKAALAALTHLLARGARMLSQLLRRGLGALITLGLQLLGNPMLAPLLPTTI